jgi:CheY-like chemotaxis protein
MKCLLCVDDDADTLEVRKLLLEADGYSVLTTSSGADALKLVAQGATIDLVLLDYLMPGMNGDELAQKLRQQSPQLPLVAVSAVGQLPESLLQFVDASVQKGQDPAILLSTVARVFRRSGKKEANVHSAAQKTILCVEDEQLHLQMQKELFESAGYLVLVARSARAAMEAFNSSHIDAVVMDYWLSGNGNGTALAEAMKKTRPGIPIVMLSGFSSLPGEWTVVDLWMRKAEIEPEKLVNEVERLIELRTPPEQSDPA